MKRTSRLMAILLAFCLAATTMSTGVTAGAVDTGTTHNVSTAAEFNAALNSAQDGDIIQINGSVVVSIDGSTAITDIPLIINKKLTFQGGKLSLWMGGIALNNDVTFRNIAIDFPNVVRSAILANGHTLTLENVTSQDSANAINVFCGGYAGRIAGITDDFDSKLLQPGDDGKIIIRGKTNLQGNSQYAKKPANIYAGNLCLGSMNITDPAQGTQDGPANDFSGTATIQIEYEKDSDVGEIYACGAQQKAGEGTGVDAMKFIAPDPSKYRVDGNVNVTLNSDVTVSGAGSTATNVTYKGSGNQGSALLKDIASLTVASGKLIPAATSTFQTVTLNSGATLGLANINKIDGNFTGGGSLILDQNQTLTISGAVSGTTKVGIGGFTYDGTQSSSVPTMGKTYIQAPQSTNASFQLAPYATQPDAKLTRDSTGAWTVTEGGGGDDTTNLVQSFTFASDVPANPTTPAGTEIDLDLEAIAANGNYVTLDFIPLVITVNGRIATRSGPDTSGYYTYTTLLGELSMTVIDSSLCITPASDGAGTYDISIAIPKEYTAAGKDLSLSTKLIVNKVDLDPTLQTVTIPTAVRNLKWTGSQQTGVPTGEGYTLTNHTATAVGSYDATATLENGYQWSDGTKEVKTISWSIAKADGPAAPTGLTPSAPTGANLADGKISGTTTDMEYSSSSDFSNPISCTGTEITSLAAGTYYVRLKATDTHEAGNAATVTVPAYQAPTDPGTKPDPDDKPTNPGDPGNNPDKPNNNKPGTSTGGNTSTSRPVTKPDGTTVTTTTDKTTGTVTVTTKRPDGSQRVEETRKDGTVVTTEKSANGSTTQTISFTDGSSDTNINQAGGLTASLSVDANGKATGEVRLPAQLSGGGQSVSLPIPAVQVAYNGQNASSLTLYTGRSYPVTVAIPTQTTSPGTVAVLVKGNGQEEVVKTCVIQNGSLVVDVPDGACVKILDNGKSFADTNQHWARDAIAFTSARDLFSGTSATNFTPDGPMGRDMLMTVLARFDGVDTSGGSTWSEKGMAWAVANGISDGSDPTGRISREQLVTMLYRYAGSPSVNSSQSLPFQDAGAVSGYAQNAVRWAVSQGILNGYNDGSLNPGGDTTRAQAATIFMQYAQYLAR